MSIGRHDDHEGARVTRSVNAYQHARADDVRFLQQWEQGLLPLIGTTARVRQIRRVLAASPELGTPPQAVLRHGPPRASSARASRPV